MLSRFVDSAYSLGCPVRGHVLFDISGDEGSWEKVNLSVPLGSPMELRV